MTNMMREHAISIFSAAVDAVQPSHLMQQHVQLPDGTLTVCGKTFSLPAGRPVWVFGAGKAAAAMAQALEPILSPVPVQGIVITKYEHALPLQHIRVAEAGHPLPDESGVQATAQMIARLKAVQPGDVVLFLLSGGASALLADYPEGASLTQVQQVFELLLKSGADIHEMNVVRKHLSSVKGGQLALLANTHAWCSLILSDVVGDDLSIIGSGPTVPDPSTFSDAVAILDKYSLTAKLPAAIHDHLQRGCAGDIRETPKPGHQGLHAVNNFLIGSNAIALEAAKQKAIALGYSTQVLTSAATGQAASIAAELVAAARDWKGRRPACILMGGESTVTVTGHGLGGRNQHLALAAGQLLAAEPGITILSAGTDGTDGPTDAAGAVTDSELMLSAAAKGLDAAHYLEQHDAYHFFEKAGGLIKTGPTQTNVMDIMLAIIS
ncbi:glycerate kinase [Chitinophaga sp. CF418]|uniref:glycerate kinase type-2 family protein n=1 Tax=Chitinophaga sp. CF418 TaxID=1855287 RepID=UPI00090EF9D4|nr:glycerate kinase [Chitinophaga sp. CF418]SHN01649.1 hydroxypyruvate reductase [Chitinophaga sp. CF418]